jgi:hypothetical protein
MDNSEAKEKAVEFEKKQTVMAEATASKIEDWLREHKDASFEEAHEELVNDIKGVLMLSTITLMMMA